jgi:membrane associated rhomboid family serine protease
MRIVPGTFTKTIAAMNIVTAVLMLIPALYLPMMVAGALIPARFTLGTDVVAGYFLLPAVLTPISSAFLHANFLHLGMNMMMLIVVAPNVERVLGTKAVIGLYSAGLLAAALAECLAKPESMAPVVGASGAISALIASYAQLFPREQQKPLGPIPPRSAHALKLFAGWSALNAMLWFAGPSLGVNIAVWAHIGGFAAGLLLTWPLLKWRYRNA